MYCFIKSVESSSFFVISGCWSFCKISFICWVIIAYLRSVNIWGTVSYNRLSSDLHSFSCWVLLNMYWVSNVCAANKLMSGSVWRRKYCCMSKSSSWICFKTSSRIFLYKGVWNCSWSLFKSVWMYSATLISVCCPFSSSTVPAILVPYFIRSWANNFSSSNIFDWFVVDCTVLFWFWTVIRVGFSFSFWFSILI